MHRCERLPLRPACDCTDRSDSSLNVSRKLLTVFLVTVSVAAAVIAYDYLQGQSSTYGDISIEQAILLIETRPDLVIVDVRTPEEYETGYIEGAVNICVTCDAQELLVNLNPDDEILLYCRTGSRSATAARILNENGYHKVYNMLGRITARSNTGYTIVSPS